MDKTEWPTQERLESLRDKGVTAYSPFLSRLSGTLLAVVVLYASLEGPLEVRSFITELLNIATTLNTPGEYVLFEPLKAFSFTTLKLLIAPIAAYVVGSTVCGLFQTRFLFMHRPSRVRHTGAFFASMTFLAGLIGAVTFSAFAFRFFTPEILRLVTRDDMALIESPRQLFRAALPIIILVGGAGALLSWMSSRAGFLRLHRMTKAEVIREMQNRE